MRKGILERLNAGEVVIGDGGYVMQLERRGYVKAPHFTPEAAVEHPEAVRQLHREFQRAGADVLQTLTFYSSDEKLQISGNVTDITGTQINEAACDLAREIANESDALVAAGVSQTPVYPVNRNQAEVKAIIQKQLDVFKRKDIDFYMVEFFKHVEEAVWAVEVMKAGGKPVGATLCISPQGDKDGTPPGECAVRLVRAGADMVGINCHLDPLTCVRTVKLMKEGLEKAGLKAHLIVQPLGFHTPECNHSGYTTLAEYPFAMEARAMTRWDMQKYAREAYNAGIRYIGGCCGFEPYHIRALAEEMSPERGVLPAASDKHGLWGAGLATYGASFMTERACREYWENLLPASGRPNCPSMSRPALK
ncbi:unnamed protein product [Arctogadus glacialis]